MVEQKVINVNFFGGLVALFNSPRKRLEKEIKANNDDGFRTVFILPGQFNIVFAAISLLCLLVTCFIYQPLPGYMVILEKNI